MKTIQCPSCGAGHTLHNPGISTIVCDYCRTTIYLEEDVLRAGTRAVVAEPRSSLAVGRSGTVEGRPFTLVGRVQFEHATGRWDEWYAVDSAGRTWWIVEDEKTYSVEQPTRDVEIPPDAQLGTRLELDGSTFEIDEIGSARCIGGEGQLPRMFQPGEEYDYFDASEIGSQNVLSIERAQSDPSDLEVYYGRAVRPDQVEFGDAPAALATDFTAGVAIQCVVCGAGFATPKQEEVVTAVCTHCGTQLELSATGLKAIGQNPRHWEFPFSVGDGGLLQGHRYEVVGRLVHDEGWGEYTREYLLWSKGQGYRWLEEYQGNYVLMRPTQIGPSKAEVDTSWPRSKVEIAGQTWTCFERGHSTIGFVDGALPWLAKVGDKSSYVDFIDPPRMYSVETSKTELERFVGEHVDGRALFDAFGKPDAFMPPLVVGPASPRYMTAGRRAAAWVGWVFAALNVLAVVATLSDGTRLMEETLGSQEVANGEWTSPAFTVAPGTTVLGLEVETTLDNGWLAVDTELLEAGTDDVVGFSSAEVAYYHGYEGGESWSEGNRKKRRLFKAPPAGEYRIGVTMEGDQHPIMTVSVTSGNRLTRYPLMVLILSMLVPVWFSMRSSAHEQQRWGADDDDD